MYYEKAIPTFSDILNQYLTAFFVCFKILYDFKVEFYYKFIYLKNHYELLFSSSNLLRQAKVLKQ